MKLRWAALIMVLALSALKPRSAAAQVGTQPPARQAGSLGQNYPNPFNPETWFSFSVDSTCAQPTQQHAVSIRIFNLLAQQVAVPVLYGRGAGAVAGDGQQPIEQLSLSCGTYTAYWNGKYASNGREAASGVYLYRLEVDGRVVGVRRFLVAK